MPSAISPVFPPLAIAAAAPTGLTKPAAAFHNVLQDAIGTVEGFRRDADGSVGRLLAGEGQELHQAVLATQRAELALELALQVRNKVVQAYQEVMRSPL
jgi:flagellar hook-basal body complex protein FliE